MADFKKSYKNTSQHEGGWNIDNGGWTYLGLSIKGHPNWIGWPIIKTYIAKNGFPKHGAYFPQYLHITLQKLVYDYFKKTYWDKIYGDFIKNQTLADFCYDFFINSGRAIIIINKAIGARVTVNNFNEDTLKIINERTAFAYQAIYNARKNYYSELVKKPQNVQYKDGWFARLEKFPKELVMPAAASSVFFWPFSVV